MTTNKRVPKWAVLWGGIAAVLSGVVYAAVTPLMATVGFCQGACVTWLDKPLVIRTLGRWLANQGWFAAAPGQDLYFGYGRYFVLVYVFIIFGLIAFHLLHKAKITSVSRGTRQSYQLLLYSLVLASFGDFVSYGLGVFSEAAWRLGFGLEVLSWIGVVEGSVRYGLTILRSGALPRWTGFTFMLTGLMIPVMFFDQGLIKYMPNAQMLPYTLGWMVLGGYLMTRVLAKS